MAQKRRTAADNSFTPAQLEQLFETAARLNERALRDDLQYASITSAFLIYVMGYLGFRLGYVLHFCEEECVTRNGEGEIVALIVPNKIPCPPEDSDREEPCPHCWRLAKAKAQNADGDAVPEDFFGLYWSPKSPAGGRWIPVPHERGREIIELFIEHKGEIDMCAETVRRRLTRVAEFTQDVSEDQMMPQSLRASAANYWMALEKFDVEGLKILMGWKYIKTAEYYLATRYEKLRFKMERALGRDPSSPYEIDPNPRLYSEIEEEENPINPEKITPETEPARHEYADHQNPLEAEAQHELSDWDGVEAAAHPVAYAATSTVRGAAKVTQAVRAMVGVELDEMAPQRDATPLSLRQKTATAGFIVILATVTAPLFAAIGAVFDPTTLAWQGGPWMTTGMFVGFLLGTARVLTD